MVQYSWVFEMSEFALAGIFLTITGTLGAIIFSRPSYEWSGVTCKSWSVFTTLGAISALAGIYSFAQAYSPGKAIGAWLLTCAFTAFFVNICGIRKLDGLITICGFLFALFGSYFLAANLV